MIFLKVFGQNFITSRKHNNAAHSTFVVGSLKNGCLNFDKAVLLETPLLFSLAVGKLMGRVQ